MIFQHKKENYNTYVCPNSWAKTQLVNINESPMIRQAFGSHIAPILLSPLIPLGGDTSVL